MSLDVERLSEHALRVRLAKVRSVIRRLAGDARSERARALVTQLQAEEAVLEAEIQDVRRA